MATLETDHELGQLFRTFDQDGSGYIDQERLTSICSELTVGDLNEVFSQLDKDQDGRISVEEFAKGYRY